MLPVQQVKDEGLGQPQFGQTRPTVLKGTYLTKQTHAALPMEGDDAVRVQGIA